MKNKSKPGRKPKFTEPSKRLSKRVPVSQHERLDQLLDTEIEPFKLKR